MSPEYPPDRLRPQKVEALIDGFLISTKYFFVMPDDHKSPLQKDLQFGPDGIHIKNPDARSREANIALNFHTAVYYGDDGFGLYVAAQFDQNNRNRQVEPVSIYAVNQTAFLPQAHMGKNRFLFGIDPSLHENIDPTLPFDELVSRLGLTRELVLLKESGFFLLNPK